MICKRLERVVETSVTVNNNSPIQDYVHPDDQTQTTFEITPWFKPFTDYKSCILRSRAKQIPPLVLKITGQHIKQM